MRKVRLFNDFEDKPPGGIVENFLPATIQFIVHVPDEAIEPETANYWPVMVIGSTLDDVNFEGSTQDLPRRHLLRIGFCNREWRLLLQVRTEKGVFTLKDNQVLPPGVHEIVAVFDTVQERIELRVNGEVIKREQLRGTMSLGHSEVYGIGHNRTIPVLYLNYFLEVLNELELDTLWKSIDHSRLIWSRFPDGSRNCNRLNEVTTGLGYSWVSPYYHARFERDMEIADRILDVFGESDFKPDDPIARVASATEHVENL